MITMTLKDAQEILNTNYGLLDENGIFIAQEHTDILLSPVFGENFEVISTVKIRRIK